LILIIVFVSVENKDLTNREDDVMNNEYTNRKQSISLKWIKAESGCTYVCDAEALSQLNNPSEDELRRICMDESGNPQND